MFKKSQVQQIIMYLVAIILFSLLLVYGYDAIKNFKSRTDDVTLLQLKNEISSSVKKVSADYGTIIKKDLNVPLKYKEICFVDLIKSGSAEYTDICQTEGNPIVCDSWKSKADYNMFLISKESTITYNVGNIRVDDPFFFCIDTANGKTTLRLEGKGSYALISGW